APRSGGKSGGKRGRKREASGPRRSREGRSSNRPSEERQRSPRGGRARWGPGSGAEAAGGGSETCKLVRRAVRECLGHVLRPYGLGLRKRGDRPRDPADARITAPRKVKAIGCPAQQCVRLAVARRRLPRQPVARGRHARANGSGGLARR